MHKLLLVLVGSIAGSTIVGSLLLSTAPAHAAEVTVPAPAVGNPPQKRPDLSDRLEFTEEESDAAIARFGCDCPTCINALRQLRHQSPLAR